MLATHRGRGKIEGEYALLRVTNSMIARSEFITVYVCHRTYRAELTNHNAGSLFECNLQGAVPLVMALSCKHPRADSLRGNSLFAERFVVRRMRSVFFLLATFT